MLSGSQAVRQTSSAMLNILSSAPWLGQPRSARCPASRHPYKGCQACISRYRRPPRQRVQCSFFLLPLDWAPLFPAVCFIKLQRPKKKNNLPCSPGSATSSHPPFSTPQSQHFLLSQPK